MTPATVCRDESDGMYIHELDRIDITLGGGTGAHILIGDAAHLTPAERREVPKATLSLFERWDRHAVSLPPSLEWARSTLLSRRPVLERVSCGDRLYWTVRFAPPGDVTRLHEPCFGADGVALAPRGAALPSPLDWLASTFGTCSLVPEQSGTAPWGRRLRAFREERSLLLPDPDIEEDALPDGSDDWLALYEVDGDALFVDPITDRVHWVGSEWTGEPETTLEIGGRAAASFVLWRMLDGGWVRPSDLARLAACCE